jgi:hypothetical protein
MSKNVIDELDRIERETAGFPADVIRDHAPVSIGFGAVTASTACIVEVAADSNAMVEALAEFGVRMMFEHGGNWGDEVDRVWFNAKKRTMNTIADELRSKQGYVPPKV